MRGPQARFRGNENMDIYIIEKNVKNANIEIRQESVMYVEIRSFYWIINGSN